MASALMTERITLIFILLLCGAQSENDQDVKRSTADDVKFQDIVVVVLTQPHPYHVGRAQLFRKHFEDQISKLPETDRPELVFTHEQWPDIQGDWTVFPLMAQMVSQNIGKPLLLHHIDRALHRRVIPNRCLKAKTQSLCAGEVLKFAKQYGEKTWIVVCEEETRMDLQQLSHVLQQYDPSQDLFIGRGLRDQQSTIIHHFAFMEDPSSFAYPDFASGMALSLPLIKRVADKLSEGKNPEIQFSIDPKHELAKYIWDHLQVRLTPTCEFCGHKKSDHCQCATWQPSSFPTDCGPPVEADDLFVAVKTCSKFHQDRVKVVKGTWGKETDLIEYYSDKEDAAVPTIDLGVPNTERGHCGKTRAILRHVTNSDKLASVSWLLIADDDTIINLELLRHLLACYHSEQPVHLGERYGYAVSQGYGYNYITGGGGMVFNRAAVELLGKEFTCPNIESPDDMLLGMFFASRGPPITHSRHFHQARPDDYSEDLLGTQIPVSFHKHWNCDPYKVYERLKSATLPLPSAKSREEL